MTVKRSASLAAIAVVVLAVTTWAQTGPQRKIGATSAASAGTPDTYTAPASAEPVIYSSKERIATGFEQRTLMLHDSHGSYMVETAQRDRPGGAEVHLMDTDVTYIVKGSATIVTGGTVVDVNPHPASRPDNPHPEYEIRGARIVGGNTHNLSAGDSIVIPKGVPHWYSEVEPPFWYFNIKVR
ncbi:MAG: hypothetical protein ND807_05400 [Vicinamibacterales bacterium]|nr:hypothetical protein [Vicinamibacterales bacterium]